MFIIVWTAVCSCTPKLEIRCDFPGGNVVVGEISGDTVRFSPDLRDTEGYWFYWYFAVSGAGRRTITFVQDVPRMSTRMGVAYSLDKGTTWDWLGDDSFETGRFSYRFDGNEEVRFSMGMPYTEANFRQFIRQYEGDPVMTSAVLCSTPEGREVEMISVKPLRQEPLAKVLVVARHHACEMMASYVLEGILSHVMQSEWLLRNVEFIFIPFMDKDGVENGDQGKNRRPHDHYDDYLGESIYRSTAALREYIPLWGEKKLRIALDLHCPNLYGGGGNDQVFIPGSGDSRMFRQQRRFAELLEENITGELPFYSEHLYRPEDLSWTRPMESDNPTASRTFTAWAYGLEGMEMAASPEIPYACCSGAVVEAGNASALGKDIGTAIELFLKTQSRAEHW